MGAVFGNWLVNNRLLIADTPCVRQILIVVNSFMRLPNIPNTLVQCYILLDPIVRFTWDKGFLPFLLKRQ